MKKKVLINDSIIIGEAIDYNLYVEFLEFYDDKMAYEMAKNEDVNYYEWIDLIEEFDLKN